MLPNRFVLVLAFLLVGGCGDKSESLPAPALPVASLPGVYSGVFPCDGCPGIATTLWLRADGTFFFEQRYAAAEDREALIVNNLGRWRSMHDPHVVELTGEGPMRKFTRLDQDVLDMWTDSDLEHRLARDRVASEFSGVIRMSGTMRMQGGRAFFAECLAGIRAPVNKGGDFGRFWHQYRSVAGRGAPTHVELEGRFLWADDGAPESLTIERFVTVREQSGC